MKLKEFCKMLDIDYDSNLLKFGNNEMLYRRFLKKLLEDTTFEELKSQWEEKQYKNIETLAHTLKGVSANLGITRLYRFSDELVQKIRNEEFNDLKETYEKLENEYIRTKDMINELE